MKLDDTQTAEFIKEYYPPSPYNKDMEQLTLERATKATEEEKELFITTSKPIENFFTQGQIHIPVHCPHCHTLSWYSIHQHSLMMVGLGGLYSTCRCCRRTFLPVHHYGHNHRHAGLIAAVIILAICLIPCIVVSAIILSNNKKPAYPPNPPEAETRDAASNSPRKAPPPREIIMPPPVYVNAPGYLVPASELSNDEQP